MISWTHLKFCCLSQLVHENTASRKHNFVFSLPLTSPVFDSFSSQVGEAEGGPTPTDQLGSSKQSKEWEPTLRSSNRYFTTLLGQLLGDCNADNSFDIKRARMEMMATMMKMRRRLEISISSSSSGEQPPAPTTGLFLLSPRPSQQPDHVEEDFK